MFGYRFLARLGVLAALISWAPTAHSQIKCGLVHQVQTPQVQSLVKEDAWAQWRTWEQRENFEIFRKSEEAHQIGFSLVPKSSVQIKAPKNLPPEIIELLSLNNGQIRWMKHPYNEVNSLPHFSAPVAGSIKSYFTASRSMTIEGTFGAYTIKMPTDRPHGPKGEWQPSKASTKDDIDSGRLRSSFIEQVDRQIGKDDKLIIALELITVADKKTGEGYLIRDVSFMKDGHYYLPALSLPYVGRKIAEINGQKPDIFWGEHYAALLGSSKAKLLLRYGIQMETPNTQNMLIQLDRNLKPTGRLVFRDVSDTHFVEPVAKALGFNKAIEKDIEIDYKPERDIEPYWENSAWRLDEAGSASYPSKLLADVWGPKHNEAYKKTIEDALGVRIPEKTGDTVSDVNDFLKTDTAQRALRDYRRKLIAQNALP